MSRLPIGEPESSLTEGMRCALLTLPLPSPATPHPVFFGRYVAARSHGDLWRKASKHWDDLVRLERLLLVERRESRGEVLWRLTRPQGYAARRALTEREGADA